MTATLTRRQVLDLRVHAQQLGRLSGSIADTAVLDLGVQDTGPDGGLWALALRGVEVRALAGDEPATVWTIRGAPHLYRRDDLPGVAAATAPFSDADAGKRIYDASKPLKAAGIGNLEALDAVAAALRSVVTAPTVKGEVSARVTGMMSAPYLRSCRPCDATHLFEMPFRLAALRAGLELQPGTSPPVLRPAPGLVPTEAVPPQLDVVRGYLHLLGPARPQQVAGYLDAPVADVRARWPEDAVEVSVDGERRWLLAEDADRLGDVPPASGVHLLGPFDLFLQARDRPLLVPERDRAKALWPVLGRPGAVLVDGDVAGTWRPRKTGSRLTVAVDLWAAPVAREAVTEAAERLAAFRGVALKAVEVTG
ncbi:winged helix DNA-binding domain-containing protein [Geodermatophilus sp. DF01-2]|uniref:winged helix DNA-binding domain-containing protein n=1 Tax=Geodermatophilus sp. DF01-2 TaxID=2559610 RepID=UPI0010737308|nr:winged helix DNA-binding domain-containing protein [Geodermatophilus sp. DF01_2]TFV58297.1 winged helix DNA-binding domain-containing protein [Geodermatophilus sp. DF01_2]